MALHAALAAATEISMSILDGVSLLLAAGLFIYLLVALLRAGRT
jgi:K+-transporting ATPase ATPase F chain